MAASLLDTMPSPTTKILVQPRLQSPTTWTVSSVKSAIDAHEEGDFADSGLLSRALGRDDRIGPCITDRENALVGGDAAHFDFQAVEGTWARRSKATIAPVQEWWNKAVPSSWLRSTLKSAITIGASISHIRWAREKRRWVPSKLTCWNPENFFWSDSDGLYVVRTAEGAHLPIAGDDPNWFVYTPGGDQSWLCGSVRGLGIPYVMRQWNWRDWARYNERHGQPIIRIREPSGETDADSKAAFYDDVRSMGASGVIRLPQGDAENTSYDVDLIEAKARSHDSFDKFIERLNTAVAIYLKGQNLSTEVQGGAYASTAWHMRVRKDFAETDAVTLADALRERLIKPWGRFNVSSWNDEIAPWPHWDLTIPEDKSETAKALLDGVNTLKIAYSIPQANLDIALLAEKLGLPQLKGAPAQKVVDPEDIEPPEDDDEPVEVTEDDIEDAAAE